MMIVGIDVSKDKLDVCVLPNKAHYVIKNNKGSISSFFKNKLDREKIELVVFESTGGYERRLHLYLLDQEIAYHRAHPNRVYHFAQSKGLFAKTDRLDAEVLARYGQQEEINTNQMITKEQLKIQGYSSRRNQLKEMLSGERRRQKAMGLDKEILRSIKRQIKQLERELQLMTEKLNELIHADDGLAEKRKLLQTVIGVGNEVSAILVTDLPELGHLNREQISHLVGVAPRNNDSGQKKGYRAISRGRFYLRRALYMAALVATRYNKRMKGIYERLVDKGKAKKVALVAVMRKMIIMLNAMVKNNTPWEAQRI